MEKRKITIILNNLINDSIKSPGRAVLEKEEEEAYLPCFFFLVALNS
jgi:hypothetical protein